MNVCSELSQPSHVKERVNWQETEVEYVEMSGALWDALHISGSLKRSAENSARLTSTTADEYVDMETLARQKGKRKKLTRLTARKVAK